MSLKINIINPETDKRWDEFVNKHPDGSIYHHSLWGNVVSQTYGHQPFYLALENTKTHQFEGIIPLMLVKSRLTGKRLVSMPFASYCSLLIPDHELKNIIKFALNYHPSLNYFEFKLKDKIKNNSCSLKEQSFYTNHIIDLSIGVEQLFQSFHLSSVRQMIKRAEKKDLKFRLADKEEDLKAFYKLETAVRKKHGLFPQPYSFFKNMWRYLEPQNYLLLSLIEYQKNVIAAAITLRFKNVLYGEYSVSDSRFLNTGSNQKMIWEIMKIAHREGVKKYDLGRSSNSNQSLIQYKERWGAKEHKLFYYYYPKAKKVDTDKNNNLVYKGFSFTNRHLPSWLLQLEGKLIYPHFG